MMVDKKTSNNEMDILDFYIDAKATLKSIRRNNLLVEGQWLVLRLFSR